MFHLFSKSFTFYSVPSVARPRSGSGDADQGLQFDALDRRQLVPHEPLSRNFFFCFSAALEHALERALERVLEHTEPIFVLFCSQYSEELMDLADQQGFMVIDEVPAVGLE